MSESVTPFVVASMNPALANTYMQPAFGTSNVREDLADLVYMIDPDETPLVSSIATQDCKAIQTDWTLQTLNPADDNRQPEGFRYAPQPALKPARYRNICQILVRAVTVSNTAQAAETVGGNEFDRQSLLKGKECRRDLEWAFTRGNIQTLVDPRRMSGIQTWLSQGSMGATGALPVGDGSNGPTAGTPRALILDMVEDGMQQAFQSGGTPSIALMSPRVKRVFSNLAWPGTASPNPVAAQNIVMSTEPKEMTIVGAVGVFLSDFGRINLVPDRFMPDGVIEGIDPDYVENAPLTGRDMVQEEYARTGDARDGAMIFEGTLRVTAPKAHFMVGDIQ